MDRATAKKLVKLYQEIGGPLNTAARVIDSIPDSNEKRQLSRPLGEVMQKVYLELLRPVIRQYPDLDPDKK